MRVRGRRLILANGSTVAEGGILGEREFAGPRGGVYYRVRDPSVFRGKHVVVVGGGDTGISFVERLTGIASRITLVHRKPALHTQESLPAKFVRNPRISVLLDRTVEEILGAGRVRNVRLRSRDTGEESVVDADAVVMAVGRRPNTAIFRDLGLSLDDQGQVRTDEWQRTSVPGFLAVGDVSSHLKMIVTAVAQGATAAHEAYQGIRTPYWK
jgi:thioredoxin reductase (NADPH)